jgi:replicative DNA helicase
MANIQNRKAMMSKPAGKGVLIDMGKGVVPPHETELEEAVLGAILIDSQSLNDTIDILNPEVFYSEAHVEIFRSIKQLFNSQKPIDILTVANDLKTRGVLDLVGGDYYLAMLSQKVSSSAHTEFHARLIIQKHIQRELIRVSNEIIKEAYDPSTDVLELLDHAEGKIFEIADGNLKKNFESAENLIVQAIKRIQDISKKDGLSGVASGFNAVDKVTSGWQMSDLIIIAARPGMGKTAYVLSMARNIAVNNNQAVALFSLEMSSVQLITRMISSETGLSGEQLRKGTLEPHEWQQLNTRIKKLEKAPIYIDDTPALSVFDLRAKCRRLKAQFDIQIIIVDYLQLMTTGGDKNAGNREQEISIISRSLKGLAKELNIPVIALSQLNRSVETRGSSKRPLLADLRESGAIEQDADLVCFIYRPEYYGFDVWDDEAGTPCQGQAEFLIAKHRNGATTNVRLRFEDKLAKFSDLEAVDVYGAGTELPSRMNNDVGNMNEDQHAPF